ncbi:MAG TPA: nucleoside recognition domain-containing protein [Thermaerobacter sp.]
MLDLIWLGLLVIGLAVAAATGRVDQVTEAVMASSQVAVETVIGFLGVTSLWLGIMKIAEEAGLVTALARWLHPLMRRLFPSIPDGDPALGAVVMSISANILGVGPAATPLGLKAMQELQRINPHKHAASDAMVTFLAMTTSGITLVPATVIAVRAAAGSAQPAEIVGPTLVASTVATAVALVADRLLRPLAPVPPPPAAGESTTGPTPVPPSGPGGPGAGGASPADPASGPVPAGRAPAAGPAQPSPRAGPPAGPHAREGPPAAPAAPVAPGTDLGGSPTRVRAEGAGTGGAAPGAGPSPPGGGAAARGAGRPAPGTGRPGSDPGPIPPAPPRAATRPRAITRPGDRG